MKQNIKGQTFGRWTVKQYAGTTGSYDFWHCHCECGTKRRVRQRSLLNGKSRSCGCRIFKHRAYAGGKESYTHTSYRAMRDRCLRKSHVFYHYYGARGITICPRWLESYTAFLEDMGERPPGMTLDRIDSNKGYEKSNCRWATRKTQAVNRRKRKSQRYQLTDADRLYIGQMSCQYTASQLAEKFSVSRSTIYRLTKQKGNHLWATLAPFPPAVAKMANVSAHQ